MDSEGVEKEEQKTRERKWKIKLFELNKR